MLPWLLKWQKKSTQSEGYPGLVPGLRRTPGEGIVYSLWYSYLENSMDRITWWAIYSSWGHKELDMAEQLTHTQMYV